jgi:hypothetical protein
MSDLIPAELRAVMLANGRRAASGEDHDPPPVVKLFTPDAGATWLLTELDPDDPDIAFGLCDLGLGFLSLARSRLPRSPPSAAGSASRWSAISTLPPTARSAPMPAKHAQAAQSSPDPAAIPMAGPASERGSCQPAAHSPHLFIAHRKTCHAQCHRAVLP